MTLRLLLQHLGPTDVTFNLENEDCITHHIEKGFAQYLSQERGLSPATLANYIPMVRHFLTDSFNGGAIQIDKLSPSDVTTFILRWEAWELIIEGKGPRKDRLPISWDVGEALVTYLQHGRPICSTRRVFIRIRAPHNGFSSSVAVCNIVERALLRAKLQPPCKGAYLLRHSLGTHMLRKGASLTEISEILRHASINNIQRSTSQP